MGARMARDAPLVGRAGDMVGKSHHPPQAPMTTVHFHAPASEHQDNLRSSIAYAGFGRFILLLCGASFSLCVSRLGRSSGQNGEQQFHSAVVSIGCEGLRSP